MDDKKKPEVVTLKIHDMTVGVKGVKEEKKEVANGKVDK